MIGPPNDNLSKVLDVHTTPHNTAAAEGVGCVDEKNPSTPRYVADSHPVSMASRRRRRLLRYFSSSHWLYNRTLLAYRFRSASSGANQSGDDHYNHYVDTRCRRFSGSDRRKSDICDDFEWFSRDDHHRYNSGTAGSAARGSPGSTLPTACVASRLLDMEKRSV